MNAQIIASASEKTTCSREVSVLPGQHHLHIRLEMVSI